MYKYLKNLSINRNQYLKKQSFIVLYEKSGCSIVQKLRYPNSFSSSAMHEQNLYGRAGQHVADKSKGARRNV